MTQKVTVQSDDDFPRPLALFVSSVGSSRENKVCGPDCPVCIIFEGCKVNGQSNRSNKTPYIMLTRIQNRKSIHPMYCGLNCTP